MGNVKLQYNIFLKSYFRILTSADTQEDHTNKWFQKDIYIYSTLASQ